MYYKFFEIWVLRLEMDDNSFLPLGSIVHLKSQQKKLMIIGYLPLDLEQSSLMYDYIGCLYPEGVLATDKNILFNQKDIKEVIKRGYHKMTSFYNLFVWTFQLPLKNLNKKKINFFINLHLYYLHPLIFLLVLHLVHHP